MAEAERKEPTLDKPADQPSDKPADQPIEAAADKPADKPANQPADQSGDKPAVEPWERKRLGVVTARNHELSAENARLQAQLAAKDKPADKPADQPAAVDEEEVNRRVQGQLTLATWNRMCNDIAQAGTLAHPDFTAKVKDTVEKLVGNDPGRGQAYVNLVNAASETDSAKAHEILYTLVSDPNEFDRVLGLSPVKMAVEMTRMLGADGAVISRAPKPIRPVGSRGQTHEAISPSDPDRADHLDTKTWMQRREKEVAEKAKMN